MINTEKDLDEWLTTEEAAEELKLSARTLIDLRYKGGGPRFTKFGRSVRYQRRDLLEWGEEMHSTSGNQSQ